METHPNGVAKIGEYHGENNIMEISHDFYLRQASKVSECSKGFLCQTIFT